MRKTYLAIGALALLGVLVVAGCGGGGSSTGGEASSAETASAGGAYGGGYGGGGESAPASEEGAGEEAAAKPAAAATGAANGGATAAVVKAGEAGDLGTIIIDSANMTVYDFHKDKGTTSACYGACAQAWPPVITSGEAKAEDGAQASLLGTTKRKDGTLQVTYNGHPLYTFVGDKKPGEANGNDFSEFGAQWYALEPNGEEPKDG